MNVNEIKDRINEILEGTKSGPLPTSSVAEIAQLLTDIPSESHREAEEMVSEVDDLRFKLMVEGDPIRRSQIAALIISKRYENEEYY